ncbi:somatostatin receptor type 2 [Hydra vulgaris]|uniref:Somatostatin receptor type 2 n=1 Tax=Hydra vulgaris TaxID=6087 RepID=A0ABM4B621_HYDVU
MIFKNYIKIYIYQKMVDTALNCTELLMNVFGNTTTVGSEKIKAARYFCEKINTFNSSLSSKEYFNEFCCKNDFLSQMCITFLEKHIKQEGFSVVCSSYLIYSYVLIGLCVPLGLPANFLILILNLRHHILPKQTSYFLGSLSVADIGVIINFITLAVYQKRNPNLSKNVSQFLMPSTHIFFVSISMLQICVVSIERAMAVTWPLQYTIFFTPRRAKIVTLVVWLWGMSNLAISLLRIHVQSTLYKNFVIYTFLFTLLVFPMVIVFFSYLVISLSAFKKIRHDKECAKFIADSAQVKLKSNSGWSIHTLRQKEIKVSVNIAAMVLPFLCCWMFFTFTHVNEVLKNQRFNGIWNWFILALPMFVSSTNPVVYILLTKPLRKKTRAFFKKKLKSLL